MKIDFLTQDDDLLIRGGDFVIDDGVRQQAQTIIMASKGGLRNNPLIGLGLNRFVGSSISKATLANIIKNELLKDNISLLDSTITRTNNSFDLKIDVIDNADV